MSNDYQDQPFTPHIRLKVHTGGYWRGNAARSRRIAGSVRQVIARLTAQLAHD